MSEYKYIEVPDETPIRDLISLIEDNLDDWDSARIEWRYTDDGDPQIVIIQGLEPNFNRVETPQPVTYSVHPNVRDDILDIEFEATEGDSQ